MPGPVHSSSFQNAAGPRGNGGARHSRREARPLLLASLLAALVLWSVPISASAQGGPGTALSSPAGTSAVPEPPGISPPNAGGGMALYPMAERARSALPARPANVPSVLTSRLRALDSDLQVLGAQGGGGSIVNAVLSVVSGGLAISLGVLSPDPEGPRAIYLYIYGGVAGTRGVLDFVLNPDASDVAITYAHMPMQTPEDVQERLLFGEAALSNLAERRLISRVVDASLNIAAGIAVVPVYLAPNDFVIDDPLDYFVLIGAGISIITGVITLASPSTAERRWSAYRELLARLRAEDTTETASSRGLEGNSMAARDAALTAALESNESGLLRVAAGPTRDGEGAILGFSGTF